MRVCVLFLNRSPNRSIFFASATSFTPFVWEDLLDPDPHCLGEFLLLILTGVDQTVLDHRDLALVNAGRYPQLELRDPLPLPLLSIYSCSPSTKNPGPFDPGYRLNNNLYFRNWILSTSGKVPMGYFYYEIFDTPITSPVFINHLSRLIIIMPNLLHCRIKFFIRKYLRSNFPRLFFCCRWS